MEISTNAYFCWVPVVIKSTATINSSTYCEYFFFKVKTLSKIIYIRVIIMIVEAARRGHQTSRAKQSDFSELYEHSTSRQLSPRLSR